MTKFNMPLVLLVMFVSDAHAECFGRLPPDPVQVRIVACSDAESIVKGKIAGKQYSETERQHLSITTKAITIVDVELIADVEIIDLRSRTGRDTYKGKIVPIKSNRMRRYMMLGTPPDHCETFHRGKTVLADLDSAPFSCCQDSRRRDANETVAQCLIGLPRIAISTLALDKLRSAEIKILPDSAK